MSSFKKTIKTIVLFAVIVILFSVAFMAPYCFGENYFWQDARERRELSGTVDFLVCGTSHALRAFKPDVLDQTLQVNSYNLSASYMTMQGRYEMLKIEIARNPVETVVMDVSYNSMTRGREEGGFEGDFYVLGKLKFPENMIYFLQEIQPSEYIRLYYDYLEKGYDCLKMAVRGTWTGTNQRSEKGYTGFRRSNDQTMTDYSQIYHTKSFEEEIEESDVEYLQKIVDLCAENGIELILVTVPMSEKWIYSYSNFDVFRIWYEVFAEENNLIYYDFNLYKERGNIFSEETDFYDQNHLSDAGAEKFSELFSSIYSMYESGENVSDLFYDNYEEMESRTYGNE